jgi:hypothetical protein
VNFSQIQTRKIAAFDNAWSHLRVSEWLSHNKLVIGNLYAKEAR